MTDTDPSMAAAVQASLEDLKALVAGLVERLDALEARVDSLPDPDREITPAVLAVISAACAAYLGKRATIKQVHLHRDSTWRRQGRSDVQHSHHIAHGRR